MQKHYNWALNTLAKMFWKHRKKHEQANGLQKLRSQERNNNEQQYEKQHFHASSMPVLVRIWICSLA